MDTLSAFAMGQANQGKPLMVLDWNKAAELIRDRKPKRASAGLASDWEYTGGLIFEEGSPVKREDTYCYLASTWAEPELDLDGAVVECWKLDTDEGVKGWDAHTFWPESALAILNGGAK